MTNGDKLSSSHDGRAELELGGATARVAAQTDIGVLNLTDQIGQIELAQGSLNITVRSLDQGASYEIDTPTVALVIQQPGTFRVDVGANGNGTRITAYNGNAMVYGENNAQRELLSQRSYDIDDATLQNVTVNEIEGGDAFDAWCSDRDARYASSASAQYVSDDVVGSQDLDDYGAWQNDSDYGQVWYPSNVAVGWAPYRYGHWVWIGPWGWTWVDDLPWGFAPYHYGRWAYIHGAWGWLPGPRRMHPVYAPALVAFVGLGGAGPVGWFPLGPGEVYNPWYRASRGYYTQVNVTNINIHNAAIRASVVGNINHQYGFYQSGRIAPDARYANRAAPHGFSAVSGENFASARGVRGNLMNVDAHAMAAATVLPPGAIRRPTLASFGPARSINVRPLPSAAFNRPVVARTAPAASIPTNTIVAGRPAAANVRVLNRGPVPVSNGFRPAAAGNEARPTQIPSENFVRHANPGEAQPQRTLPQEPRLAPAQELRPVEAPRAEPQPADDQQRQFQVEQQRQLEQQRNQEQQQQRFQETQQSHNYVPEQQRQEAPQSYRPQPQYQPQYRPEQGQGQQHQPAPHPSDKAPPPPRRDDYQH